MQNPGFAFEPATGGVFFQLTELKGLPLIAFKVSFLAAEPLKRRNLKCFLHFTLARFFPSHNTTISCICKEKNKGPQDILCGPVRV